jgi:hypothetical protein
MEETRLGSAAMERSRISIAWNHLISETGLTASIATRD